LAWKMEPDGLTIDIPPALQSNRPCQQAYAFKMEGTFFSAP
jgi:hypothetical protein